MTTGVVLGTSYNKPRVCDAAREAGFDDDANVPSHKTVENLRLQIHSPCYFSGVEGIVTEIEFDDLTDSFPDNPRALDILKQLYEKVPDLRYKQKSSDAVNPLSKLLDHIRASELLDAL